MKIDELIAIDVHTHAEVSCRQPHDEVWQPYDEAASKYFKVGKRPTIAETDRLLPRAQDRARHVHGRLRGADRSPAHPQRGGGRRGARRTADIMIAFASIDPHKGRMGVREARSLIDGGVIRGFKFHPTVQGFFPNDRMAYPLYEVIAEHKLPAIFHSGHSGIGTGMRGGGGLRLKYSSPMHIDDVAVDFPDMTIIIAHPSWPWQDEALSVCLHKPNVYIDLSGWSPKYFPAAAGPVRKRPAQAQDAVRLGLSADRARIAGSRISRSAGFKPEVHDLILKQNAMRALNLVS